MRIIGHRGARNIWAENSLSGFRNVCGLGVDAVELDVHLSSDGEIMVIHDPLLDRTTDHKGPVGRMSREALGKVRLDDTLGETIPTLPEVLDVFGPTGIELEIEMKMDAFGNPYPGLLDKVIALVEARSMASRVVLTCFVPEVIEEIRAKAPGMRRLASVDRRSCEALRRRRPDLAALCRSRLHRRRRAIAAAADGRPRRRDRRARQARRLGPEYGARARLLAQPTDLADHQRSPRSRLAAARRTEGLSHGSTPVLRDARAARVIPVRPLARRCAIAPCSRCFRRRGKHSPWRAFPIKRCWSSKTAVLDSPCSLLKHFESSEALLVPFCRHGVGRIGSSNRRHRRHSLCNVVMLACRNSS